METSNTIEEWSDAGIVTVGGCVVCGGGASMRAVSASIGTGVSL